MTHPLRLSCMCIVENHRDSYMKRFQRHEALDIDSAYKYKQEEIREYL